MAKGNDGNLLQHAIEAELGVGLFRTAGSHGLHVVLTHGMEPFEACEPRSRNPSAFKKLEYWLVAAAQHIERMDASPAIVHAYHLTQARLRHYPNSAEILAAILGRSSLRGWVCETDQRKVSALKKAWRVAASQFSHDHGGVSWSVYTVPLAFRTHG